MEKEVEQNTSIEPQTEEQEQQPNKKLKERLKERFKETSVGKWLYANPKKFYFYAMTLDRKSVV